MLPISNVEKTILIIFFIVRFDCCHREIICKFSFDAHFNLELLHDSTDEYENW
jgi:hypothetical protein